MSDKHQADPLAVWAAMLLVVASFAGSYGHVVDAVRAGGQQGWFVYVIAAMPEVTVALGMRRWVTGQRGWLTLATLVSGGGFTLAGNLNGVAFEAWPIVVAAWPAYSAVLAIALAGGHRPPPELPVAAPVVAAPAPVARPRPVARPAAGQWPAANRVEPVTTAALATPPARTEATASVPEVASPGQAEPLAVAIDDTDPVIVALRERWDMATTPNLPGALADAIAELTGASARTVRRRATALRAVEA